MNNALLDAFSCAFSLEDIANAYCRAKGDVNKARDFLTDLQLSMPQDNVVDRSIRWRCRRDDETVIWSSRCCQDDETASWSSRYQRDSNLDLKVPARRRDGELELEVPERQQSGPQGAGKTTRWRAGARDSKWELKVPARR
jgi:hypothetical protein